MQRTAQSAMFQVPWYCVGAIAGSIDSWLSDACTGCSHGAEVLGIASCSAVQHATLAVHHLLSMACCSCSNVQLQVPCIINSQKDYTETIANGSAEGEIGGAEM